MSEFRMIEEYFSRLHEGQDAALSMKDDGAVIAVPDGHELVVSTDTLNEGVHFLKGAEPEDIAHKALRSNLSDIAAMGAWPYCYQLAIAFPEKPDEDWLKRFTGALREDHKAYGVFCSGGDTTSVFGECLSVSITMMGFVPKGQAVKRSGAQEGDAVLLTGPVGDAYLGLRHLQGRLQDESASSFAPAYLRPQPRTGMDEAIRAYAHAAIDISDGLVADLGHVCRASGIGAWVELDRIIFSGAATSLIQGGKVTAQELLSGGDDYELLLAVPADHIKPLSEALISGGAKPMVIGRFTAEREGVAITDDTGQALDFSHGGWQHFSEKS